MIYIAGDIHGLLEVDKVVNYMNYQSTLRKISKDDYLIILGNVGVCWDGSHNDSEVIRTLQSLPVTTLFIDGNHEAFPLLYSYPETEWHGGIVHEIAEDILHLMRGYVFEIDNKKFSHWEEHIQ